VQSFAKVEEAGFMVQRLAQFPGVGSINTPEGERIELFENTATNLTFTLDSGGKDATADRHNRPLPIPIAFHHIHLYAPQGADRAAKAWYAETFGGVPGKRSNYEAVDFPGVNLNFSGNPAAAAPTKGRMLDHIGFEIENLEAFCKRLEARGTKFDTPYTKGTDGVATAMLIDPWGTSIELTEGLNRW
jgi:extradiol dioxygenase family protein